MKCNVREFARKTGRLEDAIKFMIEQGIDKKVTFISDEVSASYVKRILMKDDRTNLENMSYIYLTGNKCVELMESCDIVVAHVLKSNVEKLETAKCELLEIFTTK